VPVPAPFASPPSGPSPGLPRADPRAILAPMARLFVALELPPALVAALSALPIELEGAKRTPAHQLHLTLRFLGETSPEQQAALISALASLEAPPLSVALSGVAVFGQPPRVLWAGLTPEVPLKALAAAVEARVRELGFPPADHPFAAHVTLARFKASRPAQVQRFLERHRALASAPAAIEALVLFSSVLSARGAEHRPEARFPLRVSSTGA
jgi:2'-5' RNA ligase